LKGVKMGVVKGEGMHLLIPFWQTPYIIDVRKTPKNINTSSPSKGTRFHFLSFLSSFTITKYHSETSVCLMCFFIMIDLQTVKITLRVLYRPNKKFLPQLFNEYGEDYDERLLPSLGNDVLKAVVVRSNSHTHTHSLTHILSLSCDFFCFVCFSSPNE
jgi:prohibitin 1